MEANWYIELELEFDPPVMDENVIQQRIEEKNKEWSQKVTRDVNNRDRYNRNIEAYKNGVITADMIGESNKRAEISKQACDIVYGPIDKLLKQMRKRELPTSVIENIAKKQKVSEAVVRKRAAKQNIKVVEGKEDDYEEIYNKYYKTKPDKHSVYNQIESMLQASNAKDLYHFLFEDKDSHVTRNLPLAELVKQADELKKTRFYKNDDVSSRGSKLCEQCRQAFKDEASRTTYNNYLEYEKRKAVLLEVKEIYKIAEEISPEFAEEKIQQLTKILGADRKQAEKVFTAFCKMEKITLPGNPSGQADNKKIKVCRCGCTNDVSDGRTKCASCGMDLQVKCPKCGALNDNVVKVCKCGFRFENMDKAGALCALAGSEIDRMELDVAQMHLSEADRLWPGFEKVIELKQRLADIQQRLGDSPQKLKEACRDKNYIEAKKLYEHIRKFFPEYKDEEAQTQMESGIQEAQKHKELAEKAGDEASVIAECTKAYEACHDLPGVSELMSKFPPKPGSDLKVSINSETKVNALSWGASTSGTGIVYHVIRKEGGIPLNTSDGVLVGRVNICSVTDGNILPGVNYYYGVFAERAGIFSSVLASEAVINLFEISNLRMTPGDRTLQFTWDMPADNAAIVAERECEGNKETIECTSRSSFVDKDLINDKTYQYRFYLRYNASGKQVCTEGVRIAGSPVKPAAPIERIDVRPLENNDFEIKWVDPEKREVRFFFSEQKMDYLPGDLLSLKDLQKECSELMVNKTGDNIGKLHYDGEAVIYVTAAVIQNDNAIMGEIVRIRKGGGVKINSVNPVNGKIFIRLEPPAECTALIVLYRNDRFPEDVSQNDATRKYVSIKQFWHDSGIYIDSCESMDYYFSVFAEFRKGLEKDYSAGTEYLFSNVAKQQILYSVSVTKKLFGTGTLNITFEGENKKFTLPDIDIMSSVGVAPMFKKSANLFYSIPGKEADGMVSVQIPLDKKLIRETYIKAFLKDEGLQDRYQLKLKVGANLKIS